MRVGAGMNSFKDINSINDLIAQRTAGFDDNLGNDVDFSSSGERRFRVSIYVDISIPESNSLEEDRDKAREKAESLIKVIESNGGGIANNAYIGGVKHAPVGSLGGELLDEGW